MLLQLLEDFAQNPHRGFSLNFTWGNFVPQILDSAPLSKFLDPPPMDSTRGTATGPCGSPSGARPQDFLR